MLLLLAGWLVVHVVHVLPRGLCLPPPQHLRRAWRRRPLRLPLWAEVLHGGRRSWRRRRWRCEFVALPGGRHDDFFPPVVLCIQRTTPSSWPLPGTATTSSRMLTGASAPWSWWTCPRVGIEAFVGGSVRTCGGHTSSSATSDCYEYDNVLNTWRAMDSMSEARHDSLPDRYCKC